MKVAITGANGFIGSWTILAFLNDGFEVHAFSRTKSSSLDFDHERLFQHRIPSSEWPKALKVLSPEYVIHCDWSGVANSEKNSDSQSENISRWIELSETEREVGVKKSIFLGSQAEFGANLELVPEEASVFSPITKYGFAKVSAHRELDLVFKNSSTEFIWARLFSTYGALDQGSWLIPSCFRALKNGEYFKLSSGKQKWNYLHGVDIALALVSIVKSKSVVGQINIANFVSTSIFDLVSQIGDLSGKQHLLYFDENQIPEIPNIFPVVNKVKSLGWKPTIDLPLGLSLTSKWLDGDSQVMAKYGLDDLNFTLPEVASSN